MLQTYEEVLNALPLLLKPSDAAEALGISIVASRKLFNSKVIPGIKTLGTRKCVTRTNFLKWLDSLEEVQK